MKPFEFVKRSSLRGADGVKYLWETFPNVPFFEIPFPVQREMGYKLPLLTEASDPKFLHPYLKIYKALIASGDLKAGKRILLVDLSEEGERARKVSINLSIVFAFEKLNVNLVDLDLDSPGLHRLLGMRNLEGLLDHLFLGTPVSEIIRETNIPVLSLVTPGKRVEFDRKMTRETVWSSVFRELTPDAGIVFAVSTRESTFDPRQVLSSFDGILLFFSDWFSLSPDVRKIFKKLKKDDRLIGLVWSQDILIESSSKEQGESLAPVEGPGNRVHEYEHSHRAVESGGLHSAAGDDRSSFEGGEMAEKEHDNPGEGRDREEDREPVMEPESGTKKPLGGGKERRGFELLGPVLMIFVLFVIILAGLLWWSGYFDGEKDVIVLDRPSEEPAENAPVEGVPPAEAPAAEEVIEPPPVVEEAAPPAEEPQQQLAPGKQEYFYSINVASYTSEEWARRGLESLVESGVEAYLVPVDIAGKGTWMRLMVGSFRDRNEAQQEMTRLVRAGILDEGRVISTPLAYRVGEWNTREEAVSAMASLRSKGFHPYVVTNESGGAGRYSVYLGAFQGRDQAVSLERFLEKHSLEFELAEREG